MAAALSVGATPQWLTHWLPWTLLLGAGIGMTLPVLSGSATQSLPATRYAVGSAVNSSFMQLGTVLGISIFVAVLGISIFVAVLGTPTPATALGDFHRTWWVAAAIGLASGAVWLLPRLSVRRPVSGKGPAT